MGSPRITLEAECEQGVRQCSPSEEDRWNMLYMGSGRNRQQRYDWHLSAHLQRQQFAIPIPIPRVAETKLLVAVSVLSTVPFLQKKFDDRPEFPVRAEHSCNVQSTAPSLCCQIPSTPTPKNLGALLFFVRMTALCTFALTPPQISRNMQNPTPKLAKNDHQPFPHLGGSLPTVLPRNLHFAPCALPHLKGSL